MKKRISSLLLAACMILGMLPTVALADDAANGGAPIDPSDSPISGDFGDAAEAQEETQEETVVTIDADAKAGDAADDTSGIISTAKADDETTYVAEIGETKYETLAKAVEAASSGDTITLLNDASGCGIIIKSSDLDGLTIDFDGHTYTVNDDPLAGSTGTETQCFQLLTGGSVTMKNGAIVADNSSVAMIIQNYCNLTLENMTLDATQGNNTVSYVLSNNCGDVTISNSTITAKDGDVAFDVYGGFGSYGDVSVTVTGNSEINGTVEVARSTSNSNNNTLVIEDNSTVNGNVSVTAGTSVTIKDATIGSVEETDSGAVVTVLNSTVATSVEGAVTVVNSWVAGTLTNTVANNVVALVGDKTYTSLADAIDAAKDGGTVTLLADIAATKTVTIPEGANVTLDLNGKTLSVPDNGLVVNGSLTVTDSTDEKTGKITSTGDVVEVNGNSATFTLESGTIKSTATFGNNGYGVSAFNGGTVTVNGGTITALYAAVSGNNTEGDMNVYVNGGTLTAGEGPAIYMPSDGVLSIAGGTLNGGVMARMGDITISGGEILNENTQYNTDTFAEYYNYSGNVWYPNAVTLYPGSYSGDSDNNLSLTITGGTIKSTVSGGDAVAIYVGGKTESTINASITGGTFTAAENGKAYEVVYASNVIQDYTDTYDNAAETAISGGTFSTEVPEEYCADGFEPVKNDDGTYTVEVAVTGIELKPTTASIEVGKTVTLTATVSPENAADKTVTWTSNNEQVATVDKDGVVTGVAAGTATITATAGDASATCTVTVTEAAEPDQPSDEGPIQADPDCNGGTDCPFAQYKDYKDGWYHQPVDFVILNKIMLGMNDGSWGLGKTISRAEIAQMMYNMKAADGYTAPSTATFKDVAKSAWYYKAIEWANTDGCMVGVGNGKFEPNRAVTRQEFAMVMYRVKTGTMSAADKTAYDAECNAVSLSAFSDSNKIASWALTSMKMCVKEKIMQGTNTTQLMPLSGAKREEAAQIMMNYLSK